MHATGLLVGVLIALAAIWLIARAHQQAVDNAQLPLDNFAVVVAEHTRLALLSANPGIVASMSGKASAPDAQAVQRYFADLYRGLELAYDGRVFLVRDDGTLLATLPSQEGMAGRNFSTHPLFPLASRGGETGAVEAGGIVERGARLVAYRRVKGYPLLVAASMPLSEVLVSWRRDSVVIAMGALLFCALGGAAAYLLGRQLRVTQQLTQSGAESAMRLDSIISSAMDAVITVDESQKIILFNTAAEKIFRCPASEAVGLPLDRFIPARYRVRHREHVKRFGEAGATMRRMGGDLVLSGLRATGEEFPIDASISHVDVADRKFYTVILRDITERYGAATALSKSHQELRELYESMHQVREAERTRIARELHDELAQWLTALKMDVAWVATRLPREHEQLIGRAERMKSVVDSTVAAVRRIAADLRPVMLDDLGLVPALESLLNDLSDRAGIDVTVNADSDELDLREPLVTAVYRMVQEALTNVARHANATAVAVDVTVAEGKLRVRVRDNGQGLKPDPNRKSFGLLGIRGRARTLGGDARIYSPAEGGTIVEIDIPLEPQPVAGAAT